MRAVGPAYWVDSEAQLDALTAISGSGPAYFFAMIEHLGRAGRELGLDAELAAALARAGLGPRPPWLSSDGGRRSARIADAAAPHTRGGQDTPRPASRRHPMITPRCPRHEPG